MLSKQSQWVLKSDFGCEGEETLCGLHESKENWSKAMHELEEKSWIVQAYCSPQEDKLSQITNFGVFVVAGKSSGCYSRTSLGPTDHLARFTPTLIR